jgi:poly(3-hydroxybutyrate) depolymerase
MNALAEEHGCLVLCPEQSPSRSWRNPAAPADARWPEPRPAFRPGLDEGWTVRLLIQGGRSDRQPGFGGKRGGS